MNTTQHDSTRQQLKNETVRAQWEYIIHTWSFTCRCRVRKELYIICIMHMLCIHYAYLLFNNFTFHISLLFFSFFTTCYHIGYVVCMIVCMLYVMNVCMYECMYVCMYVPCMYVCMSCMNVCHVCTFRYVCMSCMYMNVCTCTCESFSARVV